MSVNTPSSSSTINFHFPDDDDDDICPVCDGDCTCPNNTNPPPPLPAGPLSMAQLSALHATGVIAPRPQPLLPSLKIKLTVPQSLLVKKRPQPTPRDAADFSASSSDLRPSTSSHHPSAPNPKRRGRPPKSIPPINPHSAHRLPPKKKSSARCPALLNPTSAAKKSATARRKRKRRPSSDSSDLGDLGNRRPFDQLDDDAQSDRFPTFVSASAFSSRASSSSPSDDDSTSSDLSTFDDDSDSSIEAEEEHFIRAEMNDRARVRRQLLGDDAPKKNDYQNAWVIRPRKNSEGPTDAEMDVDTDATVDEDEEEEEEQAEEDDEETDGLAVGAGYVGLATGWSDDDDDDDESSFDADLFFENLSGSDSSTTSSGDDGDQSDLGSAMDASINSLTAPPIQDNPAFEVTESWDGQIMFTNGLREGQCMLDMDFEAQAAQYRETTPSQSQDSDVEMSSEIDDGGYEQDLDDANGDTTDEELVGDDDLPNERAMRLFNLPFSVSAINPLSTMSPGPRDRKPFSPNTDSPRPADILSGKVFWDSDDLEEFDHNSVRSRSLSSARAGPRTGHFEPVEGARKAIIDGSKKDVPSPHPRFRRRKPGPSKLSIESILQLHLDSLHSPVSLTNNAPFQSVIPPTTGESGTAQIDMSSADIVDLNELLEASFLAPDPSDCQSTDNESRKSAKNFNRWDVVSVGAFRQSREVGCLTDGTAGWTSDAPVSKTGPDYNSMIKSSPLSMLWSNKKKNKGKTTRARKMSIVISPVILPVKDGDRTPTNHPIGSNHNHTPPHQNYHHHHHQHQHQHYQHPQKTRKELRRERKLKRKSFGPVHHPHHQHHVHQHHPNSKSRAMNSMQRNNFFMSSIPPLNI